MRKPFVASYGLLALFFLTAAVQRNMEFLIYALVLVPLVILLHLTDKRFHYKSVALWGFALWMLLHLLGGLSSIHGVRLYDYMLLNLVGEPYMILKYDQVVHFYCYVVISGLLGSIITNVTSKKASVGVVAFTMILAATGVGAVNEIIEFLPVVLFNSPGPGGYVNTALDLIMNFLGSCLGTWLFLRKR